MKLIDALRTEDTLTENGMTTNSSSLNHCVDLFFQIGAMRGQDKNRLISVFTKAYGENPLVAMKLLFWSRDVRGGAGERQIFKDIITHMVKVHKESIFKNIHLISEFGRWDDILTLIGTPLESCALETIVTGLNDDKTKSLVAKWMPRLSVNDKSKKVQAEKIRKHLKLSPKEYRRLLSGLSNTVEQAMCSKNWNSIEYSKLPSKAMADYMKAFNKNDSERFQAYITALKKGETKINAGAVYPYDIIKSLKNSGVEEGANAQWNALPNYMEGNTERVFPVCDVSSSMTCSAGGNENLSCMDICISLGLYISERNVGPFQDAFITFNNNPTFEVLKGSLYDRYSQLRHANWGGSTSIENTFKVLLSQAVKHNVEPDEMPTMIIILSDMEFNVIEGNRRGSNWNPTAIQMITEMYTENGYAMPKLAFWNLNARNDNFPVKHDEKNTVLISGFSPSILTNLLAGKDLTPEAMMLSVVNSERYSLITI
jgi:hypothetical protein